MHSVELLLAGSTGFDVGVDQGAHVLSVVVLDVGSTGFDDLVVDELVDHGPHVESVVLLVGSTGLDEVELDEAELEVGHGPQPFSEDELEDVAELEDVEKLVELVELVVSIKDVEDELG